MVGMFLSFEAQSYLVAKRFAAVVHSVYYYKKRARCSCFLTKMSSGQRVSL